MAHWALNGLSPPPGSASLRCRSAWSSSSALILITPAAAYRLATVCRRLFPVSASILWNSLPPDVQSSTSLTNLCHKLKTYLSHDSHQSFPDTLLWLSTYRLRFSWTVMTPVILATLKILIWFIGWLSTVEFANLLLLSVNFLTSHQNSHDLFVRYASANLLLTISFSFRLTHLTA